jgi:hypothetical protein
VGGLGRYLVNFFIGVIVGEFRVKELVLNTFSLPSVYRLILVGVSRGNSIVDGRFQWISLISFFRDLINL